MGPGADNEKNDKTTKWDLDLRQHVLLLVPTLIQFSQFIKYSTMRFCAGTLAFLAAAAVMSASPAGAFVVQPGASKVSGLTQLRRRPGRRGKSRASRPVLNDSSLAATTMKPYLETLVDGNDLTADDTEAIFSSILADDFDPLQVSALLMLLRAKGETKTEVAGMVRAMNKGCNAVNLSGKKLLDIVGTGGDGADTINISTAR